MPSHVDCNQAVMLGKHRVELAAPLQATLGGTVQKQNRTSGGIPLLNHVQLGPTSTSDSMGFHVVLLMRHTVAPANVRTGPLNYESQSRTKRRQCRQVLT